MSWFNRNTDKETALTAGARKLSELVDGLDQVNRERAGKTIYHIVQGIGNLGSMPESVTGQMWALLITLGRKALMPGSDASALMEDVKAGLSPQFKEMIFGQDENA